MRKSPPAGEGSLESGGSRRASGALTLETRPLLTLHQLHDNVDGLFLGADPDETHNVGMAVLFQDPVEQRCLGCV